MNTNNCNNESNSLKFYILIAIFIFCVSGSVIPTVAVSGGWHHGGYGLHGGHGGHFGGHGGHFGGLHFGGGHRHFGNYNSGYGGGYRYSYQPSYNYYPRSYSFTPRYSSPRAYTSYSPRRYVPSTTYISRNVDPNPYSSNANLYNTNNNNSTGTRYIEKGAGNNVTDNLGWQLLAQNNAKEALGVFAGQAGRHQEDGVPKVGFALSTAMQGDLDRAVWAMRRAFSIDPNSLHYINIEQRLRVSIDKLIAEFNLRLHNSDENRYSDAAFMVAALNYLIHNDDAARIAIEEAVVKAGDSSQSALNLHNLVKQ